MAMLNPKIHHDETNWNTFTVTGPKRRSMLLKIGYRIIGVYGAQEPGN
jgi:hypothetical protein